MNEIFRFMALRPPDNTVLDSPLDLTEPKSELQRQLMSARSSAATPLPAAPAPPSQPSATLGSNVPLAAISAARAVLAAAQPATFVPPRQPSPNDVPRAVQQAARAFLKANGTSLVSDPGQLPLGTKFDAFLKAVSGSTDKTQLADLANMVQTAFSQSASSLVGSAEFQAERTNIEDSIVLIVLLPELHRLPLDRLVDIRRMMDLADRIAANDALLNSLSEIQSALQKTILLPPAIFPLRTDIPYPRMGDLLIVKQNLKRYELGEIGTIENILLGETRTHTTNHTLTLDKTDTTQTTTTTQTTDELDTTEKFELTNEAQNVINENISAQAGLTLSAKYGTVQINTNASFAYSQSKSQSTKSSVDHAKDVTSRAVKNVTQSVMQQEIVRRTETFGDTEEHEFQNSGSVGTKNISGLYQWLNKVYEAQVFNYGQRMLIDLIIPEPAAYLINALNDATRTSAPKPPEPFVLKQNPADATTWIPINPASDLNADGTLLSTLVTRPVSSGDLSLVSNSPDASLPAYYADYVAKYGASGVTAPPEEYLTISKGVAINVDSGDKNPIHAEDLTIPTGYRALQITVQGAFNGNESDDNIDGDEYLEVFVGKFNCSFGANPSLGKNLLAAPADIQNLQPQTTTIDPNLPKPVQQYAGQAANEVGNISLSIESRQAKDFAVNVDILCRRTDSALEQWRVGTHAAILQAYLKLLSGFADKQAAQTFQSANQDSGGENASINKETAQMELKKGCMAILSGTNIQYVDALFSQSDFNAIDANNQFLPLQGFTPSAQSQGEYIRFFEQAFEWENMTYLYYPYFWSRKSVWQNKLLRTDADEDFLSFLRAGAARVVVPIRPKLEPLALFYLMTGQIWGGGGLNGISDSFYLPISDEIKAQEGVDSDAVPQGDPWELKLPTTLLKLRDDDLLPIWEKFALDSNGKWVPGDSAPSAGTEMWVPGEMQGNTWKPDFGSVDNKGNFKEP